MVPSRLYPFDLEPLLPLLARAGRVSIVEESTAGGTWGAQVATQIYAAMWGRLRHPIALINSADAIIPAAPHLEDRVIVGEHDIYRALGGGGMRDNVLDADHRDFRDLVREFVQREVVPHYPDWEAAGRVSREVWLAAGRAGLLGLDMPAEFGGGETDDYRFAALVTEELAAHRHVRPRDPAAQRHHRALPRPVWPTRSSANGGCPGSARANSSPRSR